MQQTIYKASPNYKELDDYLNGNEIRSFLLVSGKSLQKHNMNDYFNKLEKRTGIQVVKFDGVQPNPHYEIVVRGVEIFRKNKCDAIVAVGGGSVIDVAKCIKLYSSFEDDGVDGSFLNRSIVPNEVKLLAVPTTAGTGSEATKYAVLYYHNEKQSITHESIIPDTVLMDSSALKTLPLYQRKATMLDAFCHSIESFWSVNSTAESKVYSREAIELILQSMNGYFANEDIANETMLRAAYIAGKAINITQTTAGHAMCYKLTSLYGVAHGHSAALCVKELWPWMIKNTDKCVDSRGKDYLDDMFVELAAIMQCKNAYSAAEWFGNFVEGLRLEMPVAKDNYDVLKSSVNPVRLKNNPVRLDVDIIDSLYHKILKR